MPLYEYYCPHCDKKFDKLRPFSQADAPAPRPECGGEDTKRAISTFASFSKGSEGSTIAVGGGSSCAGCAAQSCAGCKH
mgnify:CR=1 FL=1